MTLLFKLVFTLCKWSWALLKFIKNVVFSGLAIIIVLVAFTLFATLSNTKPQDGALLVNLTGVIVDEPKEDSFLRTISNEALGLTDAAMKENSLFDVVNLIRQAKDDDNISGIVLSLGQFVGANQPALEYIGKAINEFKQSGKPVIAVGRHFTQSQYYLASFADEIYLAPQGSVNLVGLSTNTLYYKSMLDKLKITTHVFRVGTYKSAVEPFIRDNMSPEAKQNAQQWVNALWGNYLTQVAANREISSKQLSPDIDTMIKQLKSVNGNTAEYAAKNGLVDKIQSFQETEKVLKGKFGSRNGRYAFVSIYDYKPQEVKKLAEKIAVIVVNGTIASGDKSQGIADAGKIVKQLRDARFNPQVKAIVLRVNSPGGGVAASEAIRSEVEAVKMAGKPVVVSMGGLAASGGYWISTPADYIIASPSTLTGSIGIFGIINTFENSLDYIGVHADGVTTSPLAAASIASTLDPKVAQLFQITVESGYRDFLTLVAQSRNKTTEQVDKIAQGQVWLGIDAKNFGLVDQLGDFDDAVKKAAELAKLKINQYQILWFAPDSSLQELLFDQNELSTNNLLTTAIASYLPQPLAKSMLEVDKQQSTFNDPNNRYIYCLECGYNN